MGPASAASLDTEGAFANVGPLLCDLGSSYFVFSVMALTLIAQGVHKHFSGNPHCALSQGSRDGVARGV